MGNSTPCVLLMDACGQRNCACVKVKFALCDGMRAKVQLLDNCIPGPPNVYVRVTRPFRFFSEGLVRETRGVVWSLCNVCVSGIVDPLPKRQTIRICDGHEDLSSC